MTSPATNPATNIVIASAARTAVGSFLGAFAKTPAHELGVIAIKAALTGHLVLSTLHTNDAASSITRLVDMGVEPFLVGSSLVAAAAQRLVRVLCTQVLRPEFEAALQHLHRLPVLAHVSVEAAQRLQGA